MEVIRHQKIGCENLPRLDERKDRLRRRRQKRKGGIEWTLTNIGAAMSLMGLMLFIFIFFNFLLTAVILMVLIIPVVALIIIGYGLIVKDHLDSKKRLKRTAAKRKGEEE